MLKTVSTTPGAFTGTLLAEEILDWMQRLTFPDERVQPLIRGVTRIHVVEESRHIRYAREELRRQMETAPRWEVGLTRVTSAEAARVIARSLISPRVYAEVGLDPVRAVEEARNSPHRRDVLRQSAKRLMDFFEEVDLLRGATAPSGAAPASSETFPPGLAPRTVARRSDVIAYASGGPASCGGGGRGR